MVWQFYDDMQACVQNDDEYSEPYPVTGLCHGTNTIQHDIFYHAHRCFKF